MSLRRRLLLTLAPLFVAGLVAVNVATYLSLQSFVLTKVDQQVVDLHRSVEFYFLGTGPGESGGGGPPNDGNRAVVTTVAYGEIVTPGGQVEQEHEFIPQQFKGSASKPILPSTLHPHTFLTVHATNGGSDYRVYVDDATLQNFRGDFLVVGVSLADSAGFLSELLRLELAAGGVITLLILLATWLIVRGGLRPLDRMGSTARAAATDLSMRVDPATTSTEVGRLGLAINAMLSQLETAFNERAANEQRLRHFVSDASHELRTPLTSIRGYAELMRRNPHMPKEDVLLATRRIEDEGQRMGVLVDDLLLLARLDQGRPLEQAGVDLVTLVADACADARAADPSRTVTARIDAPVQVLGDDMRLRQVLSNVVRNALVHTPAGSPLEVALSLDGSLAVIEVIDHGPGIPAEQAQQIFERFHRSDPGRSRDQGGSGLGLSITSAVVAAHGGRIRVQETPGGGATFRIELPGATTSTAVAQEALSSL